MAEYVFLLEGLVVTKDGEQTVKIESIITDEWEYSGSYRASVNNYITEVTVDDNSDWIEKGLGKTDLAIQLGNLIENFEE